VDFAALRSVAIGTKRTDRDICLFVRFRSKGTSASDRLQ